MSEFENMTHVLINEIKTCPLFEIKDVSSHNKQCIKCGQIKKNNEFTYFKDKCNDCLGKKTERVKQKQKMKVEERIMSMCKIVSKIKILENGRKFKDSFQKAVVYMKAVLKLTPGKFNGSADFHKLIESSSFKWAQTHKAWIDNVITGQTVIDCDVQFFIDAINTGKFVTFSYSGGRKTQTKHSQAKVVVPKSAAKIVDEYDVKYAIWLRKGEKFSDLHKYQKMHGIL